MEYVDGVTLRDIVHTDGPIEPRRAIEIIADACQALNFSHQHGIIHRDVKPANIMISKAGAVKVMDFGIARALADAGNSVTQTAAVIGTAQYLSPEQARGETVDARSDVYSLGCVLYEMLTGEPPFVGDSPVAVAYQHVREDPVPPSQRHAGISPELDAVVLKALAKNPDNRYQTAAEMRTDLIRVHSGEAPEAPKVFTDAERTSLLAAGPPHRPHRSPPSTSRRTSATLRAERSATPPIGRWLAIVAVLAVLTVVVTVAINMVGGSPRDVQVPDVRGQAYADAIAALQNLGFKTAPQQQPDSEVPAGDVIGTDPAANTAVAAGDEITINVSTGPQQREVPDCAGLTYADAATQAHGRRLRQVPADAVGVDAGAEGPGDRRPTRRPTRRRRSPTRSPSSSAPGPSTQAGARRRRARPSRSATQILVAQRVHRTAHPGRGRRHSAHRGSGDGHRSAGEQPTCPWTPPIQLQVSRGNQFMMPDLPGSSGSTPNRCCASLGWTGELEQAPRRAEQRRSRTNAVVTQSPAAGTPVKFGDPITLSFAQ